MVAVLLLLLSVIHCSGKTYYEFFGYAFDAIRVFTVNAFLLSVLSSSRCATT